jgi:hypothetical protein
LFNGIAALEPAMVDANTKRIAGPIAVVMMETPQEAFTKSGKQFKLT